MRLEKGKKKLIIIIRKESKRKGVQARRNVSRPACNGRDGDSQRSSWLDLPATSGGGGW
jgi:hypothetical protein